MRIEILSDAEEDLVVGAKFYEQQGIGLGDYFLNSIYSDIDSLLVYAGIHRVVFGFHRALSKRFPYAIFFVVSTGKLNWSRCTGFWICDGDPPWIKARLKPSEGAK
jgi:hypothetical protein